MPWRASASCRLVPESLEICGQSTWNQRSLWPLIGRGHAMIKILVLESKQKLPLVFYWYSSSTKTCFKFAGRNTVVTWWDTLSISCTRSSTRNAYRITGCHPDLEFDTTPLFMPCVVPFLDMTILEPTASPTRNHPPKLLASLHHRPWTRAIQTRGWNDGWKCVGLEVTNVVLGAESKKNAIQTYTLNVLI